MNETSLCTLYEIASRNPGWLSKLETVFHLTPEESGFLSWLDDQEMKLNKNLRVMECAMVRDGFDETLIDCETDDERMQKLNKLIFTIEDQYEEFSKRDKPYLEKMLFLLSQRYEHWLKLRKKLRSKLIVATGGFSSEVSNVEIERARAVSLAQITEPSKTLHIPCLWHDDKNPSMWIKNGWGWCYVCCTWADAIKYYMERDHRSFPDAVKDLARL